MGETLIPTRMHFRRASVIAATVLGSVLTFALLLWLDPVPWRSREYIAMAVWSLPLAGLVLGAARLGRGLLRRWGVVAATVALPPLACLCALLWAVLVYALTGPMILGTFDANPLWSWAGGALCGLAVGIAWRHAPRPDSVAPGG